MPQNFLSTTQSSTAAHGSHRDTFLSGPSKNSTVQNEATTPFKKILNGLEANGPDRDKNSFEPLSDEFVETDLVSVVTPSPMPHDSAPLDTFTRDLAATRVSMPTTEALTDAPSNGITHPSGLSVEIVSAGASTQLTSVFDVAALENQSRFTESPAIAQKTADLKPQLTDPQKTDLSLRNFNTTPNSESLSVTTDAATAIFNNVSSATPADSISQSSVPSTLHPTVNLAQNSINHSIPEASNYRPDPSMSISDANAALDVTEDSARLPYPATNVDRGILSSDKDDISLDKTTENFGTPKSGEIGRTNPSSNSLNNNPSLGFSDQSSDRFNANPSTLNTYPPISTGPDFHSPATNPVNIIPSVLNTIRNQSQQNASNSELLSTATSETNTEAHGLNRVQAVESISNFEANDQATPTNLPEVNANSTLPTDGLDTSVAASATTEPPTNAEFNQLLTQATPNNANPSNASIAGPSLAELNPERVAKPIVSAIQNQLSEIRDGRIEAVDSGVRIQLDPKELGAVTVEVQTVENVTRIQIVTDQPVAHAMLEKNIESLLQSLDQSDGKSFDVDVSQRDTGDTSHEHEQRQTSERRASNPSHQSEEKNSQQPPESPNTGGVNMVI